MTQCPAKRRDDIRCKLEAGHAGNHRPTPWCPVPGCEAPRKVNQMMCRTHWFRVPKAVRDSVWATVRGDLEKYLEARNEAIAQAHLWVPKRKGRTC